MRISTAKSAPKKPPNQTPTIKGFSVPPVAFSKCQSSLRLAKAVPRWVNQSSHPNTSQDYGKILALLLILGVLPPLLGGEWGLHSLSPTAALLFCCWLLYASDKHDPAWCPMKIKKNYQPVPSAWCVAAQHNLQKKRVSHLRKSHLTELCTKDVLKALDASYQKEMNDCFKFLL